MIYYLPLYRVLSGILTVRRKPLLSSCTFTPDFLLTSNGASMYMHFCVYVLIIYIISG